MPIFVPSASDSEEAEKDTVKTYYFCCEISSTPKKVAEKRYSTG
jgi:hypothetical protein